MSTTNNHPRHNSSNPSFDSLPSQCPQMLDLLTLEVNRNITDYMVRCTIDTVDYALGRPCMSLCEGGPAFCSRKYGVFSEFVWRMVYRSKVKMPVLLVALVYIVRAKAHLRICVDQWACVRVFVGALVLAGKYLSDYPMKNIKWAQWSGVFHSSHVGRIERELLEVLDWDLSFFEGDILAHHEPLTSMHRPQSSPTLVVTKYSNKRPRPDSASGDRNLSSSTSCNCTPSITSSSTSSEALHLSPEPPFTSFSLVTSSSSSSPSSYLPTPNSWGPEPVDIRPTKRIRLVSNPIHMLQLLPYPLTPTGPDTMSSLHLPMAQIQSNIGNWYRLPYGSALWT